eukprot:ctg_843.g204
MDPSRRKMPAEDDANPRTLPAATEAEVVLPPQSERLCDEPDRVLLAKPLNLVRRKEAPWKIRDDSIYLKLEQVGEGTYQVLHAAVAERCGVLSCAQRVAPRHQGQQPADQPARPAEDRRLWTGTVCRRAWPPLHHACGDAVVSGAGAAAGRGHVLVCGGHVVGGVPDPGDADGQTGVSRQGRGHSGEPHLFGVGHAHPRDVARCAGVAICQHVPGRRRCPTLPQRVPVGVRGQRRQSRGVGPDRTTADAVSERADDRGRGTAARLVHHRAVAEPAGGAAEIRVDARVSGAPTPAGGAIGRDDDADGDAGGWRNATAAGSSFDGVWRGIRAAGYGTAAGHSDSAPGRVTAATTTAGRPMTTGDRAARPRSTHRGGAVANGAESTAPDAKRRRPS